MLFDFLFGPSLEEIRTEPCIEQIMKFSKAVRGIPEKSEWIQSWVDLYPQKKQIVCRYFDNDSRATGFWAEQIEVYGRDTEENNRLLYESINGSNLPKGTQIAYGDDYRSFQLSFTVTPEYPKSMKKYAKVIWEEFRKIGLAYDTYSEGRIGIKVR